MHECTHVEICRGCATLYNNYREDTGMSYEQRAGESRLSVYHNWTDSPTLGTAIEVQSESEMDILMTFSLLYSRTAAEQAFAIHEIESILLTPHTSLDARNPTFKMRKIGIRMIATRTRVRPNSLSRYSSSSN